MITPPPFARPKRLHTEKIKNYILDERSSSLSPCSTFSLTQAAYCIPPSHTPRLSQSMTIDVIELRKIQYAQELAAYTMRQWMLVREEAADTERKRDFAPASATTSTSHTQSSQPSTDYQTRDGIDTRCSSAQC